MNIIYTRPKVLLLGDILFKSGINSINQNDYDKLMKNRKFAAYIKAGVLKISENKIEKIINVKMKTEKTIDESIIEEPVKITLKPKKKKVKKDETE